ncbi:MAG: glycosyltransferase family 2 protein [Bacillota bacterium]
MPRNPRVKVAPKQQATDGKAQGGTQAYTNQMELVINMSKPLISVIIPCRNEGINVENTIKSINKAKNSHPYEVIVVDDGSDDSCCEFLEGKETLSSGNKVKLFSVHNLGSSNARNLGAEEANGEIYVFCDAHLTVGDGWLDSLANSLNERGVDAVVPAIASQENPQRVGFGATWDDGLNTLWLPKPAKLTPVPIGPSGCLAVNSDVFKAVGGFDAGFRVWGFEDAELSLKLWLFGYEIYVNPNVTIYHLFRTKHPYAVQFTDTSYNLLRMAFSHFNPQRIAKVIGLVKNLPNFERVITDLLLGDVLEQRRRYAKRRVYGDDWFMTRFNIPL